MRLQQRLPLKPPLKPKLRFTSLSGCNNLSPIGRFFECAGRRESFAPERDDWIEHRGAQRMCIQSFSGLILGNIELARPIERPSFEKGSIQER
jgi:hypothetical protein